MTHLSHPRSLARSPSLSRTRTLCPDSATGDFDFVSPTLLDDYAGFKPFIAAVRAHPAVVKFGGLKPLA